MKPFDHILRCPTRDILAILLLACSGSLPAQQATVPVLSETVVSKGDGGTVTFQKVVPPTLVTVAPPTLSAEHLAMLRERAAQKRVRVTVQARTYTGAGSELRWSAGATTPLRVWTAVDAGLLPSVLTLEDGGTFYDYLVIATPAPPTKPFPDDLRRARQELETNNSGRWELVTRTDSLDEGAARALDLLVTYLVENKAALVTALAKQKEAVAAARLIETSRQPAAPSTPVVRFWTIQRGRSNNAENSKTSEGGAVRE